MNVWLAGSIWAYSLQPCHVAFFAYLLLFAFVKRAENCSEVAGCSLPFKAEFCGLRSRGASCVELPNSAHALRCRRDLPFV